MQAGDDPNAVLMEKHHAFLRPFENGRGAFPGDAIWGRA